MGVSSKGSRLKALRGKKEGLKAAASSREAGLQGTYGVEKGERRLPQKLRPRKQLCGYRNIRTVR